MPVKLAPKLMSWATEIDQNTIEQAIRSSDLPFVQPHVALMPDAHFGYGATVGSVIPTQGAIIPSAVGVDIGCGMIAANLGITSQALPDDVGPLHSRIARAVPSGVGKGHDLGSGPAGEVPGFPAWPVTADNWGKEWKRTALTQFGSLGSGNHFIEICLDEADTVWVVLHSGSRGVGNKVASMHIDGAKGLMKRLFVSLPDPDLAYFVEDTPEFDNYITDMLWAQDYAMGNRTAMLRSVLNEIDAFLGHPVAVADEINCHHNFTEREHHMGKNMWITRKGAIRAREGDRGVIPGSMGARSYVVSGKAMPASFCSCSHGAGRRMSRGRAKRELDIATLETQMAGIAWNAGPGTRPGNAAALLDEDPRAYKPIDEVMAAQTDLVTVDHELRQILNYKGA